MGAALAKDDVKVKTKKCRFEVRKFEDSLIALVDGFVNVWVCLNCRTVEDDDNKKLVNLK